MLRRISKFGFRRRSELIKFYVLIAKLTLGQAAAIEILRMQSIETTRSLSEIRESPVSTGRGEVL